MLVNFLFRSLRWGLGRPLALAKARHRLCDTSHYRRVHGGLLDELVILALNSCRETLTCVMGGIAAGRPALLVGHISPGDRRTPDAADFNTARIPVLFTDDVMSRALS